MVVPQLCGCGHEAWLVHDSGACFVECSSCGRHTGPYVDADNAVYAWNYNHDVHEKSRSNRVISTDDSTAEVE